MTAESTVRRKEDRNRVDCLCRIWSVLDRADARLEEVLDTVVGVIPLSVRHPDLCRVRIVAHNIVRQSPGFRETPWSFRSEIRVRRQAVGTLDVHYERPIAPPGGESFDSEERRLFSAVISRIGNFLEMREFMQQRPAVASQEAAIKPVEDWRTLLGLLRGTNLELVFRLTHKMVIRLRLGGVTETDDIVANLVRRPRFAEENAAEFPEPEPRTREETLAFCEQVFRLASRQLSDEEIFRSLQRWMHEEKCGVFVRTISNPESTLRETSDAIRFLGQLSDQGVELSDALLKAVPVHLIQRFLSDRLEYVQIAKDHLVKEDFHDLIRCMVYHQGSHGKLGAKGARLFLAAHILRKEQASRPELKRIRIPKTWFITTDCLFAFLAQNDFEDLANQKYKKLDQIREEYPLVRQFFRQAQFPPEIARGMAMALDDFGDVPLVVRSSSLLEDQFGAEFSGMYVSRFVANNGRKTERLHTLLGAVADLYASVFSADPIGFRAQHGLLDFEEDVGVMVQEAVGIAVGTYFMPPFAGVAHSGNLSLDSPYEGSVRLVFGLGTQLRHHAGEGVTFGLGPTITRLDDVLSPPQRRMIVFNREKDRGETLDIGEFMSAFGQRLVGVERIISVPREGMTASTSMSEFDFARDPWTVNFEGLVRDTPFALQLRSALEVLTSAFRSPLDLEFASDGHDILLLDCRPPKSAVVDSSPRMG